MDQEKVKGTKDVISSESSCQIHNGTVKTLVR